MTESERALLLVAAYGEFSQSGRDFDFWALHRVRAVVEVAFDASAYSYASLVSQDCHTQYSLHLRATLVRHSNMLSNHSRHNVRLSTRT